MADRRTKAVLKRKEEDNYLFLHDALDLNVPALRKSEEVKQAVPGKEEEAVRS